MLHDGAVVASWSRSKGYRYLSSSMDRYGDDSPVPRDWQLLPEGEGRSLRPIEILAGCGLTSPTFRCWHLKYDPKDQKVYAIKTEDWRGIAPSLEFMLAQGVFNAIPERLPPGQYIEVSIHSSTPPLPPLTAQTTPRLQTMRPSEQLALTLLIHGPLSIDQAAAALSCSVASIKAAAAALTRKGVIEPVGRGTMINPLYSIGEALEAVEQWHPWLRSLLNDKSAQDAMRERSAIAPA